MEIMKTFYKKDYDRVIKYCNYLKRNLCDHCYECEEDCLQCSKFENFNYHYEYYWLQNFNKLIDILATKGKEKNKESKK